MTRRRWQKRKPLPLFEQPPVDAHARASDPQTSKAAARSISQDAMTKQHKRVLGALRTHGPKAAEEIEDIVGIPIWRRMNELQRAGLIETTGFSHKNRSGRMARIFKLKEQTHEGDGAEFQRY